MRRVQFDEHRKSVLAAKKRLVAQTRMLPSNDEERSIRRKPRNPEELRCFVRLALNRRDRALATREYERIGPRRWRLNAHVDSDQT